jgi:hypothetical protein
MVKREPYCILTPDQVHFYSTRVKPTEVRAPPVANVPPAAADSSESNWLWLWTTDFDIFYHNVRSLTTKYSDFIEMLLLTDLIFFLELLKPGVMTVY